MKHFGHKPTLHVTHMLVMELEGCSEQYGLMDLDGSSERSGLAVEFIVVVCMISTMLRASRLVGRPEAPWEGMRTGRRQVGHEKVNENECWHSSLAHSRHTVCRQGNILGSLLSWS